MALSKQLDIFTPRDKIRDIHKVQWVDYRSISPVQEGCCLEFYIPPSLTQYLDLDHTFLKIKVGVKEADGTELEDNDEVGLTNNVLNSIFSQVEVTLNDFNVSPTTGANHPYRAFLE